MRTNKQILQVCARAYLRYERTYAQMQSACRIYGTNVTRQRIMSQVAGKQAALYPLLIDLGINADLLYTYVDAERKALAAKYPPDKEEEEIPF